jgi:hypothetical protein
MYLAHAKPIKSAGLDRIDSVKLQAFGLQAPHVIEDTAPSTKFGRMPILDDAPIDENHDPIER